MPFLCAAVTFFSLLHVILLGFALTTCNLRRNQYASALSWLVRPYYQVWRAQVVVSRSKRAVPYPILGENTFVLSESMVLTEDDGQLALMFRVGDTCVPHMHRAACR